MALINLSHASSIQCVATPALFPNPFRQGKTGKVVGSEPAVWLDAEAFEHGDQLAHVLRRMPCRAFEKLMHRWGTIEGFDFLAARLVLKLAPPFLDTRDDAFAVSRDFDTGRAAAIRRRHIRVVRPVFDLVYRGLEKRFANAKDVMTEEPNRTIAIINRALGQSRVRDLADVALCRSQYADPLLEEHHRWKRRVTAALQADKLRDVLQVLAEDVLVPFCQHRHGLHSEAQQLLPSRRIV
jgi:hypothetical protein